jgi:hypothetical protein
MDFYAMERRVVTTNLEALRRTKLMANILRDARSAIKIYGWKRLGGGNTNDGFCLVDAIRWGARSNGVPPTDWGLEQQMRAEVGYIIGVDESGSGWQLMKWNDDLDFLPKLRARFALRMTERMLRKRAKILARAVEE